MADVARGHVELPVGRRPVTQEQTITLLNRACTVFDLKMLVMSRLENRVDHFEVRGDGVHAAH
jgi:hypothetical protein